MNEKSAFNAAVCAIGIAILLIHTINILLKKNRRKDENNLLIFVIFTIVHFTTYLTFTVLKIHYTSDNFVIGFYTTFYIMNNIEALLFFLYARSCLESKKKLLDILTYVNLAVFGIYIILDIINIFNRMFFTSIAGAYTRQRMMIFSQGYQFVVFVVVFCITVFTRKTKLVEKIAFSVYCIFPFIAIILQNLFAGFAIAYLSIIVSIEVLFLFVNVRKNMELAQEAKRNKDIEIKIMISQIQPHFIYNTLASISTLIKIDPDKAQKALDDFTEYLRTNLSSLSNTGLILFSDELKHIETYLSLEKMRFDDRLNIIYDIKAKDFMVPPLSIQPLAENAVKHGIMRKLEGGTVKIKSYERKDAYIVEISDDGVGFNMDDIKVSSTNHIGLNNVKYRIAKMSHGDLKIRSEINKGTTVTAIFYK